MGVRSSKSSTTKKGSSYGNARANAYSYHGTGVQPHELKQSNLQSGSTPSTTSTDSSTLEKRQMEEPVSIPKMSISGYGGKEDEFYDGIPRVPAILSEKSRTRGFRVSARKAGSLGIEKAVGVLDTLGSSVTNLNSGSAFVTGPTTKGVQTLVSKDVDELLRTVAADKREQLKIFTGEVVRFGNGCKDPQWHNLDLYFEKQNRGLTRPKQLKADPEVVMQQLLTLVQHTADLYRELCVLDKLEQDDQQKHQGGDNSISVSKGRELVIIRQELKSQKKQVKLLKKKSLWSRSMEDVMEKLSDTVIYLNRQIRNAFESAYDNVASSESLSIQHTLGPAGLALHYANIVLQIDTIVSRSSPMTSMARSTLYQSLPPDIEFSFRSKVASFRVGKELDVPDIKAEMEKTLCWLSPVAINTAKAHHGFGWVGEWADTGSGGGRKPNGLNDINRIETLNHADKKTTEAYIVELLLWLNLLINQIKINANVGEMQPNKESPKDANQQEASVPSPEDHGLEHKDTRIEEITDKGPVFDVGSGHENEKASGYVQTEGLVA
ncbi:uncharacterized protein LOC112512767 isoform X3 [Cynara cardunculus var. scolymus]|uniref:uncharacterized protein LOC112512767 isoform X3 n=1 Tax=Cynara cardunculus var. scolymus TaxID=59895 RepID=UPI000D6283C7|nr:uncharacterized protein LOC112512767 isoform X3 [Cynara cardunculus var. scolymus]